MHRHSLLTSSLLLLFFFTMNTASAQLSFSKRGFVGIPGSTCVVTGDFNGDGRVDAAVNDTKGNAIAVFYGDGAGNLSSTPTKFPLSSHFAFGGPACLVVGDLNNDGIPDLVVYSRTSDVIAILPGTGTSSGFGPERDIAVRGISSVAIDDFYGEGKKDDVAAMDQNNVRVLVYRNDGAMNFSSPYAIALDRQAYMLTSGRL